MTLEKYLYSAFGSTNVLSGLDAIHRIGLDVSFCDFIVYNTVNNRYVIIYVNNTPAHAGVDTIANFYKYSKNIDSKIGKQTIKIFASTINCSAHLYNEIGYPEDFKIIEFNSTVTLNINIINWIQKNEYLIDDDGDVFMVRTEK